MYIRLRRDLLVDCIFFSKGVDLQFSRVHIYMVIYNGPAVTLKMGLYQMLTGFQKGGLKKFPCIYSEIRYETCLVNN